MSAGDFIRVALFLVVVVALLALGAVFFGLIAVILGIFAVAGLGIFARGLSLCYEAARIWRSESMTVREAAQQDGDIEFEGTVRAADETFETPISGEEAVLATYRVEDRSYSQSSSSGSNSRWHLLTSETIYRPFHVEDETESVLVDPTEADVSPDNTKRRITTDSLPDDVRSRFQTLAEDVRKVDSILDQTDTRRYWEGYIVPGDEVHVHGGQVIERLPEYGADTRIGPASDQARFEITAGGEHAAIRRRVSTALVFLSVGSLSIILIGISANVVFL